MNFVERVVGSDICKTCPARSKNIMTAQLRGSSYRGETTVEDDATVDHCLLFVGSLVVADIMIVNKTENTAAAAHDADFIQSVFEDKIEKCAGATPEITEAGYQVFCTPINTAVDEFIKVNYED